jgi:phosphatidate cytidylyltransferase
MTKSGTGPRRQVKSNHKGHATNGRQTSISEVSEGSSGPDSPEKDDALSSTKDGEGENQPVQNEYEKKKETFITRTIWSLAMISLFFLALFSGHIYAMMIVTTSQVLCFKEVIAIANVPSKARRLKYTKTLNWYFLATTMYYLYGESVVYYFKHIVLVDNWILPFATHHRFISFIMYMIGFIFFVATLKKRHYRFQFTQWAWTHLALLVIVGQAHFIVDNIFEGLIWFFLPCSLVITNDIWAYICGLLFGKTQLIKLSPKKTVEGFVGAWIMSIFFGVLMTNALMRYKYFICPVNDLGANIYTGLKCDPNPVFIPHDYSLPSWLPSVFPSTVQIAPMQFHILVFATFASLIAPFGGFFASGLKRTFKVKDFGETIPGHGGMTDRMDCQFIMGFFSFMYYHSFIEIYKQSVGNVIEMAVTGLTVAEQIEVVKGLSKYLFNQGVLSETVCYLLSNPICQPLNHTNTI